MRLPTFFKDTEKDIKGRTKAKKRIDDSLNLANKKAETKAIRLIDEGAVLYGNSSDIRLYLKKGVLKDWYESLSDDWVGYINFGHLDVTAFPLLAGTFTKEDLTVVDIGDGRYALDCVPEWYESQMLKDIKGQGLPMSVSIEFSGKWNLTDTEMLQAPVFENVDIHGFSLVNNPANVGSYDVLYNEGEEDMGILERLEAILANAKVETNEEEKTATEAPETPDTANLEAAEKVEEKVEKLEDGLQEEKGNEEEVELEAEEEAEKEDVVAAKLEALDAYIKALEEENKSLKAAHEAKKAEEEKLSSILDRYETALKNTKPAPKSADMVYDPTKSIWG